MPTTPDMLDRSIPVVVVSARVSVEEIDFTKIPSQCLVFREGSLEMEDHYWFGRRIDAWFVPPRVGTLRSASRTVYRGDYDIKCLVTDVERVKLLPGSPLDSGTAEVLDWVDILARDPRTAPLTAGPHPVAVPILMVGAALAMGFRKVILLDATVGLGSSTTPSFLAATPADLARRPSSRVAQSYELGQLKRLCDAFPESDVVDGATSRPYEHFLPKATAPESPPLLPTAKPERQELWRIRKIGTKDTRCAYVTYFDADGYFWGALATARSLGQVSDYPLIALVPSSYTPPWVASLPDNLVLVHAPRIRNASFKSSHQERFQHTFSKLGVFALTFLDRAIYLDADTLVLQNIDDLFDREGFSAAPDFGFTLNNKIFNSGVFAYTPSASIFEELMSKNGVLKTYDGGDQGFLNEFFDSIDWLDPSYNSLRRIYEANPGIGSLESTKVLHYVGNKPWEFENPDLPGELLKLWLDKLGPEYLGAFLVDRVQRRQFAQAKLAPTPAAKEKPDTTKKATPLAAEKDKAKQPKTPLTFSAADAKKMVRAGDLDRAFMIVNANIRKRPETIRDRIVLASIQRRRGKPVKWARSWVGVGVAALRRIG